MAHIFEFPSGQAREAQPACAANANDPDLPSTSGRRCEYAIGDLARMLGIAHFQPRTIITYLRAKARDERMPLPKTPRLVGGLFVNGPRSICLQSRWDAERFDAWKSESDGDGPCPPAGRALRADLARRAEAIARPASARSTGAQP